MSSPEEFRHFLTAPVVPASYGTAGTTRLPPLHARIFPCMLSFSLCMLLWVCVSAATMVLAQAPDLPYAAFPSETTPRVAPEEPTPADNAWGTAQALYKRKLWAQAETAFDTFRRQFAHDPRALEALCLSGACHLNRGDQQGAIRAWRFILQSPNIRPEDRPILMQAAANLHGALDGNRGRNDRERLLAQLLADFPGEETTARLHAREAALRFTEADFPGSVRFFSPFTNQLDVVELNKFNLAVALTTRGAPDFRLIMDAAGEYSTNDEIDQAIKLYQIVLQQKPDQNMTAEARTMLGWCLYTKGEWQESEKWLGSKTAFKR